LRHKIWRCATVAAVALLLCISVAANWAWRDMQAHLDRPIKLDRPSTLFEIEYGTSLTRIASQMKRARWLENDLFLVLEARRLNIGSDLKAGVYEVYDGVTPRELLNRFVEGDVKVFDITFIEGCNFSDMRETLAQTPHLRQTIIGKDVAWILSRIDASLSSAEGRFFPSTYYFTSGDSDIQILQRAYRQMRDILEYHWTSRTLDLPYQTSMDALIMASIIEKETGRSEERNQIAGVFVRRLKLGMKLQTDPTVIYGLGDLYDGNLRRKDLERDTEYNTYTRQGLPPTPISMPGEDSIRAAINPAEGKFLYFVSNGDGSHEFSTTLREHNEAVGRHQMSPRQTQ